MENSMTLLRAQIQFIDTRLSLIHIPLHLYSRFFQPIVQLLLTAGPDGHHGFDSEFLDSDATPSPAPPPFANISVTPIECSVVCSRTSAEQLFLPIIQGLDKVARDQVSMTAEDFVVIQVEGEGLDAGQRVLELTTPLAMAGISIFFITTYFSDYILVPVKARGQVVQALEEQGFAFEKDADVFVNQVHHRNASSGSSLETPPPSTPPPSSVTELQARTFSLLKRRNVVPQVDPDIRLVQCAGRKSMYSSSDSINDARFIVGLITCLAMKPPFLSVTLTSTDPASVLLEDRLTAQFEPDVLLGSKEEILIPIILDLTQLPFESTGIVCGVAGKVVGGTANQLEDAVEMSYLSTARAGTVMVGEAELERTLAALRGGDSQVIEQI